MPPSPLSANDGLSQFVSARLFARTDNGGGVSAWEAGKERESGTRGRECGSLRGQGRQG